MNPGVDDVPYLQYMHHTLFEMLMMQHTQREAEYFCEIEAPLDCDALCVGKVCESMHASI
jgi:hypothetical protein